MDKVLAAVTLAVCAVLIARLLMGETRRWRFDAAVQRAWHATTRWVVPAWQSTKRRALWAWRWPSARRNAAREAEEAIRRAARGAGTWDGKVYRPDAFHKKPPRDKMH